MFYTANTVSPSTGHLRNCMDKATTQKLLEDLKHPDPNVRDYATQEFWRAWFEQKGVLGLEVIRRAQMLVEMGDQSGAESILTQLVETQPDFAEAWNRRAVLYYIMGHYRQAIADCEQVIALNPIHFGALHGLGLCYSALGEYRMALQAFNRVLEIQPHSIENQRWLLECMAKLT